MFDLLKDLCEIHSPSGEEFRMKDFLLKYISGHERGWKVKPQIIEGEEFQDCFILKFGQPTIAAFAHLDTTGFMVRYQDQLIPIGSPDIKETDILTGHDHLGPIECKVKIEEDYHVFYDFARAIRSGTTLTFRKYFEEDRRFIYSPYLDNRAGIFNLLKVAKTLENGLLVFSSWEEHGGGSVPYLVRYIYENFQIKKSLVSDITWITDGIDFHKGVVISIRDRNIPRRTFVDRIVEIAEKHHIQYQLEVEASGSSDGREIQISPYPIDWCFVGAPEKYSHSSREKLSKKDLSGMISLYKVLFEEL